MILFETDKKPLVFLLDQMHEGELALPDFQRSFVWDPNETRELVASIIQSFPAGTLLLMRGGARVFAPRGVEGAPALDGRRPSYLVLDGQQRLTSLYQAFFGEGTHRFFLNLRELLDGEDVDEATEVYLEYRRARRWQSIENQAADLMMPIAEIRRFSDWRDEILDARTDSDEDRRALRSQLNELEKRYIEPVRAYHFPVTTLDEQTPIDAVCTIFETLNRTGVKLTVFELLTARAFSRQVRLREMWAQAQADHPILGDFGVDPYYVLQAISIRRTGDAKRSAVLNLDVGAIVDDWDSVTSGVADGLRLLRDECGVLVPRWLPYKTMLATLGAVWEAVTAERGPQLGQRRAMVRRWFWCSVFSGAYDNAANTTAEVDTVNLRRWMDGGDLPPVVSDFAFEAGRLRGTTGRQRALYAATMALLMRGAPRDFHDGSPLNTPIIEGRSVDDHHLFPRDWLDKNGYADAPDSVLNHTLIDKITNILIGGRAPSVYLQEMQDSLRDELDPILDSHGLPSSPDGPLWQNRFEDFLAWRFEHIAGQLEQVTGGQIRRP